ncbi:hypothetical protein [Clostridium sp.]|jgi:hypothetical protein|uniref:hypothetical protein n=1 Tax=Clostridium sp. TaxID=1506 RepID=UPI0039F634D1
MFLLYIPWWYGIKEESLVIGNKSIIIGIRLFSYSDIKDIYFEDKSIIIATKEKNFKIPNWMVRKRRFQLERALEKVSLKSKN